jgi:hypothetical protein
MCCKLLSIAELDKPPLTWCSLCDTKAGCTAYAQRPTECRDFFCGYLLDPGLDERWKPSVCKLIVTFEPHAREILVHVDPDRPDAWRKEPYYSRIRRWAAEAEAGWQVIVWQGNAKIVITPQRQAA